MPTIGIDGVAQFPQRLRVVDEHAGEFLDGDLLDAVRLAVLNELLPPRDGDFVPLVFERRGHVVGPGDGRGDPVRRLVARCAGRAAGHHDDLLDAELAGQDHRVVGRLRVLLAHLARAERVTRAVEGGNLHAALDQFGLESSELGGIGE
jgi:hypothetical protein